MTSQRTEDEDHLTLRDIGRQTEGTRDPPSNRTLELKGFQDSSQRSKVKQVKKKKKTSIPTVEGSTSEQSRPLIFSRVKNICKEKGTEEDSDFRKVYHQHQGSGSSLFFLLPLILKSILFTSLDVPSRG